MTNVQVPVVFSSAQIIARGLMQTNGNDIRFGSDCGSSTAFNYWLEGYMNTDTTKVWVRVPSVAANDSLKFYMFFGNSGATAGSTLTIFNGPWSAIDSIVTATTGGVGNSQRGFRFTANQDLLVPSFGKKEPTGTTRYITIFNYTTQAIFYQSQVSGPSGQFSYSPLTRPIWLSSGQQYVLEIFQGSSDGYYFGTSSVVGSALTYGDMRYCNSCTQNTFPTNVLSNYQYGYPDFLYYLKNSVTPAPTTTFGLPADTNTPLAPVGLYGIAGNEQVLLTWHRNTEFDIDKYLIFQNTVPDPQTAVQIGTAFQPDTSFLLSGLTNFSTYYFWIKAKDLFCTPRTSVFSNGVVVTPVNVKKISESIPKVFALYQNYPNPFNPSSTIKFDIPSMKSKTVNVTLKVFDVLGKEVCVILNNKLAPGSYEIQWNASSFASGIYFYKLSATGGAGDFTDVRKMVLVK
jgi:hypothetical protein